MWGARLIVQLFTALPVCRMRKHKKQKEGKRKIYKKKDDITQFSMLETLALGKLRSRVFQIETRRATLCRNEATSMIA